MSAAGLRWKRILLKIGGEAFAERGGFGISFSRLSWISQEIEKVKNLGVAVGIMVGGGNIWRGKFAQKGGIDRATADYMGMLATVINGLALQNSLEKIGLDTRVQSSFEMREFCEPYIRRRAIRHLEKRRIVIFVGGTGNPYFTTDTAAALKAVEVKAEVILKATKVDGVYSIDPIKNPNAKRYKKLSYMEMLKKQLKIMDSTAISLCMENHIPIVVFNLFKKGNLKKVICGQGKRTIVSD